MKLGGRSHNDIQYLEQTNSHLIYLATYLAYTVDFRLAVHIIQNADYHTQI